MVDGPGVEGSWPEGRLDPGAHGGDVDPDGSERVLVQAAEPAVPGQADDFPLDTFRRDAVAAQGGAGRLIRSGQGEQEMRPAEAAVPEPDGVS